MKADFHIEFESASLSKRGQHCCGDVFESRKVKDECRTIGVLSDGIGNGVKANILASLTASMAVQFALNHEPCERTADFIIRSIPFNEERQIPNASFSMVDVNYRGEVTLIEYRNPSIVWLRGNEKQTTKPHRCILKHINNDHHFTTSSIKLKKEDRLILFSDGISRSGMGSNRYPLGWGDELVTFALNTVAQTPYISAKQLANRIVQKAHQNDQEQLKDDAICIVLYCREPRKIIVASGPPYHQAHDKQLAQLLDGFQGKKAVCGGTTANIVARELKREIIVNLNSKDPTLPPISQINNIDLVTEGILTLGKTAELLENTIKTKNAGPAEQLTQLLLESDDITFMVGTRVNDAHQDPNLPVELEIRRNVIKKMVKTLEEKHLKTVTINYL